MPLGTDKNKTVEKYLQQANIILLLVSADFLACRQIYKRELKIAKEQHDKGNICKCQALINKRQIRC